jgi:hypothetical protein
MAERESDAGGNSVARASDRGLYLAAIIKRAEEWAADPHQPLSLLRLAEHFEEPRGASRPKGGKDA